MNRETSGSLDGEQEQLELDFDAPDANDAGYRRWQRERRRRDNDISMEWGVPVNTKVRISFKNMPGEQSGFLELLEYPSKISRRRHGPLKLRLNLDGEEFALGEREYIEFLSDEVASCHKMR